MKTVRKRPTKPTNAAGDTSSQPILVQSLPTGTHAAPVRKLPEIHTMPLSHRSNLSGDTREIVRNPRASLAPAPTEQDTDIIGRILEVTGSQARALNAADVRRMAGILRNITDVHEQAPKELARELRQRIERESQFTPAGRSLFQNMLGKLGVDSHGEIQIPVDDQPYWMRVDHRLTSFRSRQELPASADVVIIGAGLTGASAAYYLSEAARHGLRVVVLDRGAPASEASGRNGGNFELLPENSVGIYEGLARSASRSCAGRYPALPIQILRAESERQASIVIGVALRNRSCMKQIIEAEKIDCDFSPRGWLYLAHTENGEQAICEEVGWLPSSGRKG